MSSAKLMTLLNATKLYSGLGNGAKYYSALSDSDTDRHPIISRVIFVVSY